MNGQVGANRLSSPPVASCNGRGPRLLHLIEARPSEQSRFVNKACNMAGHDKQTRVERVFAFVSGMLSSAGDANLIRGDSKFAGSQSSESHTTIAVSNASIESFGKSQI